MNISTLTERIHEYLHSGHTGGKPFIPEGSRDTMGSLLREITNAISKLIPLERQSFDLDSVSDQLEPFTPKIHRRGVPNIIDVEPTKKLVPDEDSDQNPGKSDT